MTRIMLLKQVWVLILVVSLSLSTTTQLSDAYDKHPHVIFHDSSSQELLVTETNYTDAISMLSHNTTSFTVTITGTIENMTVVAWTNIGSVFIQGSMNFTLRDSNITSDVIIAQSSRLTLVNTLIDTVYVHSQSSVFMYDDSVINTLYNDMGYGDGYHFNALDTVIVNASTVHYMINNIQQETNGESIHVNGLMIYGNVRGLNVTLENNAHVDRAECNINLVYWGDLTLNGTLDSSYYYQIVEHSFSTFRNSKVTSTLITNAYLYHDSTLASTFVNITNSVLKPGQSNDVATLLIDNSTLSLADVMSMENTTFTVLDSQFVNIVNSVFRGVVVFDTSLNKYDLDLSMNLGTVYLTDSCFEELRLLTLHRFELDNVSSTSVVKLGVVHDDAEIGHTVFSGVYFTQTYGSSTLSSNTSYDLYARNHVRLYLHDTANIYDLHVANASILLKDGTYFNFNPSSFSFLWNTTVIIEDAVLYNVDLNRDFMTYFLNNSVIYNMGDEERKLLGGINTTITLVNSFVNGTYKMHDGSINITKSFFSKIELWGGSYTLNITTAFSELNSLNLVYGGNEAYFWRFMNTTIHTIRSYQSDISRIHVWFTNTNIEFLDSFDLEQVAEVHFVNAIFPDMNFQITIDFVFYETYVKLQWDTGVTADLWGGSFTGRFIVQRHVKASLNDNWTAWQSIGETNEPNGVFEDHAIMKGYINDYRLLAEYSTGFFICIVSRYQHYSPVEYFTVGEGIIVKATIDENSVVDTDTTYVDSSLTINLKYFPPGNHCWWWDWSSNNLLYQVEVIDSNQEVIVPATNSTYVTYNPAYYQVSFNATGDYTLRFRASDDLFRFWGEWTEVTVHVIQTPIATTTTTTQTSTPEGFFDSLPTLTYPVILVTFMALLPFTRRRKRGS